MRVRAGGKHKYKHVSVGSLAATGGELGFIESRGGGSSSNATNATELTVGGLVAAAAAAAGSVVSGSGGGGASNLQMLSGSGGAGASTAGVLLPAHLHHHLLPHLRTTAPVSPHRGRQLLLRSGTSTPREAGMGTGGGALLSTDPHGSTSALMMGSTEGASSAG